MLLPKKLRKTPLSTEVDEETGDWKVPFGTRFLRREYTPADIEWLRRHHRVMPIPSLHQWWNLRTKRKWSLTGFELVMTRHKISNPKGKKSWQHNVICVKEFLK